MIRVQNLHEERDSISAFPNRGSLQLKRSQLLDPKIRSLGAKQRSGSKSPLRCSYQGFPCCKENAGRITPKGARTDFVKEHWQSKDTAQRLTSVLSPALNPRMGQENNCLLFNDASRTQEWKQHGGRRHACFGLVTTNPVRFIDPDDQRKHVDVMAGGLNLL